MTSSEIRLYANPNPPNLKCIRYSDQVAEHRFIPDPIPAEREKAWIDAIDAMLDELQAQAFVLKVPTQIGMVGVNSVVGIAYAVDLSAVHDGQPGMWLEIRGTAALLQRVRPVHINLHRKAA